MNNIEINPNLQYILAGDVSGSMSTVDPKCANQTRYKYMLEKFEHFIKEAEDFDPDGPTVILFGEAVQIFSNTTLEVVRKELVNPVMQGWTNTHLVIDTAYEIHKAEKAELAKQGKVHPGTVLLIFTDGSPTNRKKVEQSIVHIANSIDRHDEFNIGFLTVGTIDADLRDYLTKLDDELKSAKHDIVNVSELESVTFLKAVAKAINE